MGKKSRFSIPPRILDKRFQDEIILLDLDRGDYFGLNATASSIWEMLRRGEALDQVIHRYSVLFDLPIGQAEAEVSSTIQDLVEEKLVETI